MNVALATMDSSTAQTPVLTEAQVAWARCRHWIEQALAKTPNSAQMLAHIEAEVAAGRMIFWAGPDSALITRFEDTFAGKVLVIVCAGGDSDKLEIGGRWLAQLEGFASFSQCSLLRVECHEEDAPFMEALGLTRAFTTWTKSIPAAARPIQGVAQA